MSQILLAKIDAVRRKQSAVAVVSTVAMIVLALVGLLAAGMLLDWWLDLPRTVRALMLAIDLAVAEYLAYRYMIAPILFGPDDDRVALQVEEAEPAFGHRLIASVQLARPDAVPAGASMSLVQALIAQTEAMAAGIDFGRVVKIDRLIRLAVAAAVALLLGMGAILLGSGDDVSTDLLKRAFLSDVPVPRKTHVLVITGSVKVALGDGVEISARAKGVVPPTGSLLVEGASGRRQSFVMNPTDDDKAVFSCKIDNIQESLAYRVRLNDGRSESFDITALPRPTVVKLDVQQVYPTYTRLGTVNRALGDLTILNGSRLKLTAKANHAVRRSIEANIVHLVGAPVAKPLPGAPQRVALRDLAMLVDSADPTVLTAEVELPPTTTGFSINLVDEEGLASNDTVVYRVDMVADKDPVVRITLPEHREEPVTRIEKHIVGFDAADDFGLSHMWIKYKVDDGPEQSIPLTVPPAVKSLRDRYAWDISKVAPASSKPSLEGSTIEYWVAAEDNNEVTGPGHGSSDHYVLKVVTEDELRQYIYSQMDQIWDNVKRETDNERELKAQTGEHARPTSQPAP